MSGEHINPVWKIRRGQHPPQNVNKSRSPVCSCSSALTTRSIESQPLLKKVERLEREVERKNFELDMLREDALKKQQQFQATIREKDQMLTQLRKLVSKNVVKSRQLLTLNSQFERVMSSNKENIPLNVVLEQETICKRRLDEEQLSEIKNEPNIEDSDLRFMTEINLMGREESSEGWTAMNLVNGPTDVHLRM